MEDLSYTRIVSLQGRLLFNRHNYENGKYGITMNNDFQSINF